jgi:hypothetical protein
MASTPSGTEAFIAIDSLHRPGLSRENVDFMGTALVYAAVKLLSGKEGRLRQFMVLALTDGRRALSY